MGSPEHEEGRLSYETQHPVTLTQGFWLGEAAVTQELWQTVTNVENPSNFKGEQLPVESVSWHDCQQFIDKLRQLHPDLAVSLPTEAQWEYACRAGTETAFHFGTKDDLNLERVNYSGHWDDHNLEGKTKPVKSYPCNNWGLYEMHGNIWEWCQDAWQENLGNEPAIDPLHEGKTESERASLRRTVRGGSWFDRGGGCRSALGYGSRPDDRDGNFGFRLCLR